MYEDLYACDTTSLNLPSKVSLCGTSYCDSTYKIVRPKSEFGTMEYIISGTGVIYHNGKKHIASAGDTYFLPPNVDQYYYSDPQNPWVKVFFNMTGNLMYQLANEYSFGNTVVFKNCDTRELISEIISIAQNRNYTPYEIQEKSLMQVQKIFMHIYHNTINTDTLPEELRILKDYIDSNITGNITLEMMAAKIFRSKNYVIRLFKSHLYVTPYEYFLDRKMELSKQLLTTTAMPVKQISNYLGFDSPRYFSQSFTKKYGVSPAAWRKTTSANK
ncbi:MAG: helix-turn-helix transcriptional regulator [Clostridia bacterium]|nr:helix-turn-helix transcriptional regulator [Clostridia bacterium]MBQ2316478.1 helix-turn-helix transcriptional regulator [Clostridia bacterium]MEE0808227.1 AraC family transcriptional regulator [Acutalibacteraceae bacterium]